MQKEAGAQVSVSRIPGCFGAWDLHYRDGICQSCRWEGRCKVAQQHTEEGRQSTLEELSR